MSQRCRACGSIKVIADRLAPSHIVLALKRATSKNRLNKWCANCVRKNRAALIALGNFLDFSLPPPLPEPFFAQKFTLSLYNFETIFKFSGTGGSALIINLEKTKKGRPKKMYSQQKRSGQYKVRSELKRKIQDAFGEDSQQLIEDLQPAPKKKKNEDKTTLAVLKQNIKLLFSMKKIDKKIAEAIITKNLPDQEVKELTTTPLRTLRYRRYNLDFTKKVIVQS